MKSKDIIRILKRDGWIKHRQQGSHIQFKHPVKAERVTVPHPKKNMPIKTVHSIFAQASIEVDL